MEVTELASVAGFALPAIGLIGTAIWSVGKIDGRLENINKSVSSLAIQMREMDSKVVNHGEALVEHRQRIGVLERERE